MTSCQTFERPFRQGKGHPTNGHARQMSGYLAFQTRSNDGAPSCSLRLATASDNLGAEAPFRMKECIAYFQQAHKTGEIMGYRNKTYVAFASEDIRDYRLMEAWKANENIEFDFFDAHDLYVSRDTSKPETIKRNLRERLKNAKQVVLLGSKDGKRKGGDGVSFLAHEIEVIIEFKLPVVIVNLDQDRTVDRSYIPDSFLNADYYTISVSYRPKIIMYALDDYVPVFAKGDKKGPHYYKPEVYSKLDL